MPPSSFNTGSNDVLTTVAWSLVCRTELDSCLLEKISLQGSFLLSLVLTQETLCLTVSPTPDQTMQCVDTICCPANRMSISSYIPGQAGLSHTTFIGSPAVDFHSHLLQCGPVTGPAPHHKIGQVPRIRAKIEPSKCAAVFKQGETQVNHTFKLFLF